MNETELIIAFHNTHGAIMGERTLLDSGFEARVMPMPVALGPACGIALRIRTVDAEKALAMLGETVSGVYRRLEEDPEGFAPWNP
jgi:hypothetical protein